VDSSGRPLYYWIEILDTTDEYAVIWVNVTDVPPGGTHIWMLYGDNSDYSPYNNGHKVFPFFDDFETWSGWTQYGNGTVEQATDDIPSGTGSYVAEKTGYNDPNGAYKSLGDTFYRDNSYGGLILEYWDKRIRTRRGWGPLDRVGLIDNDGNGYGAVMDARDDAIALDTRENYNGNISNWTSVSLRQRRWYFIRLEVLSNGSLIMKIYDSYFNLLQTVENVNKTYSEFTHVYIFGGHNYEIDNLRVRYYTPDEPQAVVDEWYRYLPFEPTCS